MAHELLSQSRKRNKRGGALISDSTVLLFYSYLFTALQEKAHGSRGKIKISRFSVIKGIAIE